ncbi:MAG: hypothetical protein CL992_02170 [Euryarchaeota archaeon]|nr:hypothetical protein [Euryarchaeota archaeon]
MPTSNGSTVPIHRKHCDIWSSALTLIYSKHPSTRWDARGRAEHCSAESGLQGRASAGRTFRRGQPSTDRRAAEPSFEYQDIDFNGLI